MHETGSWRRRVRAAYERHEGKWHVAFFVGGFVLDVVAARDGVDSTWILLQQVFYLAVIGAILYVEILREARPEQMRFSPRVERLWTYRGLAVHFSLGGLMNMYSIFFLMSASWFSSVAFVVLLFGAVIANELRAVQQRGVDLKIGLYVLCVFCFWSLMIPLAVGQVGLATFLASFVATTALVAGMFAVLRRRLNARELRRRLLAPGLGVSICFLAFYLVGLIPPVPVAARKMGVYHLVERQGSDYVLSHERPDWRFWHQGDENFVARPGDRIFVFVAIFSPARFDDTVFVRWQHRTLAGEWVDSDRIPIAITGGRREGFRGYTAKQHYQAGLWRVKVETRDGREIGRVRFRVTLADADPNRVLKTERY